MSQMMTCNSGHVSRKSIWDCPVCVERIRVNYRKLQKLNEELIQLVWDEALFKNENGSTQTDGCNKKVTESWMEFYRIHEAVGKLK